MRNRGYVILALALLATGAFLPPATCAGGRHNGNWSGHGNSHGHWHGHGHGHGNRHGYYYGNSLSIGLGFVFPFYPYNYPYYVPAPVYTVPAQFPEVVVTSPDQRSYTASREESEYCREYTKKIIVEGREEMAYGTACLQDNGSWRIMN